jgi:hypothetical protein
MWLKVAGINKSAQKMLFFRKRFTALILVSAEFMAFLSKDPNLPKRKARVLFLDVSNNSYYNIGGKA